MSNPFRYFNSSPEVIRLVVMLYVRYPLSLRNVEDLLAERGIDISRGGPLNALDTPRRASRNPRFPIPGGAGMRARGWRQEGLLRLPPSALHAGLAHTDRSRPRRPSLGPTTRATAQRRWQALKRDERPTTEKTIGAMTITESATISDRRATKVKRRETRFSLTKLRFSFSRCRPDQGIQSRLERAWRSQRAREAAGAFARLAGGANSSGTKKSDARSKFGSTRY
jgi:hypothetical protein